MLSNLPLSDIITVLLALVFSIGVHEAMHAYVAHNLGDHTAVEEGRLTLNPLKHVDLYMTVILPGVLMLMHLPPIFIAKPVPFDGRNVKHGDFGVAMLAVAGPLSNLGLAAIGALIVRGGFVGPEIVHILLLFILVNIGLFVFNMLPLPPLDGSRLLYAFAPEPLQRVMRQFEAFGFFALIAVLLILLPIISPVISSINNQILRLLLG